MRLLILSNYFTPDLSAGSFRMQGLVDALAAHRDTGLEVDLLTTRPNRYASLIAEAPTEEDHGWLRIHRIDIPAHKSGMADQALAYLSYARGVRKLTRGGRWDLVFATSSRLMTAGLGASVARRINAPLYLDIRDLFTDNMDELLAGSPMKLLMPIFRQTERYAFRSAAQISVVSAGFLAHIHAIAPSITTRVFTNGIDDLFLREDFSKPAPVRELPLIVYAGNMGEGQGLHRIVPRAAQLLRGRARLRLIGDGGRREAIERALEGSGIDNVEMLPPMPRATLIEHYREADLLFLHLNDLRAFHKVLPSKIFEYAATEKPILAGVAGYAAEFLASEVPSAEIFAPLDADAMVAAALRQIAGPSRVDRGSFRANFARQSIMRDMARDILGAVPSGP
jgi:glycosyltransferase involved in cell wall biosynthesis